MTTEAVVDDTLPDDPRPPYDKCGDFFVAIDMYGVTPQIEFRGKKQYKTCWGACCSLFAIIVIVAYAACKATFFLQEFPLGLQIANMIDEFSGQSVEEGIDLELAFSPSPVSNESVANWALVKQDGKGGVETVLFLTTVKRRPKTFYF
jgi:hypothetical protein